MKHITQAHLYGCVPACFAMITGDHYYGSLGFFAARDFDKQGVTGLETIDVFNSLGYKARFIEKVNFDKLDKDAILIVKPKYNKEDEAQHVVAWDGKNKKIFDPALGFCLTKRRSRKEYMDNCIGAIVVG